LVFWFWLVFEWLFWWGGELIARARIRQPFSGADAGSGWFWFAVWFFGFFGWLANLVFGFLVVFGFWQFGAGNKV
jgi:hypothetical protein